MLKSTLLVIALIPFLASMASAVIIYDNTGAGLADPTLLAPNTTGLYLDDMTAGPGLGGPSYTLNQVNVGFFNLSAAPVTFDILLQFYNTINYGAAANSPLATGPIGSTFRISNVTVSANDGIGIDGEGETGLTALIGTLPVTSGSSFGLVYQFVTPGSNFGFANQAANVVPLAVDSPPNLGTSNADLGYDTNHNGVITGSEIDTILDPATNDPANLYLKIGAVAVPEPAGLSLLATSLLLLGRKRSKLSA